ncbi:MAG: hydantoinase B/oxoprolinase family protein [Anaerolineales bacterium]|nr:hydantoinase B/oxoprolinase family protein [Anaerolineales bacterium]
MNPIRLEIFKHLFAAIPEEMGALLRRASYSPNIKERLDYSCALFDARGDMIAQAAHIPVHLGAMPLSVKAAIARFTTLHPGDVIILNDPFRGGSHLPDITLVSPIFIEPTNQSPILFGFAASRAHHADVGGMKPGSMPIAREIIQEGLIIPPVKLVERGEINAGVWDMILANVRTPGERAGDLHAQLAANARGVSRMQEMVTRYGADEVSFHAAELMAYTERLTRNLLRTIPDGMYTFEDFLDDDGVGTDPVRIRVAITVEDDRATVDFTGSAPQQRGSVNAVRAITLSAVYYVFRGLLGMEVPNNTGALAPIEVVTPEGTVVNARWPAPVAGGNVETSQRITDVLLGALAQAMPDRIPAASQGTMNNTLIGGIAGERPYTYYETIAGGMGGHPHGTGLSARHSHMTNTLNTPVEALEYAYPFLVERYEIRRGTGGAGLHAGGDGVRRDIRVRFPAEASLISERRARGPYGLAGGESGTVGENVIIRDGVEIPIPSKGSVDLQAGDVLSVRTPGGGGWGQM